MPMMPTFEVTQAQADRILAAYSARYGTTTQAETVLAYKREIAAYVRDTVLNYEADRMQEEANQARQENLAVIEAALPDPTAVT